MCQVISGLTWLGTELCGGRLWTQKQIWGFVTEEGLLDTASE